MQGRTVLVVEDDRVIRESLQEVLEDEGYRVVCAGGGREALSLLRSHAPPCMALVDLMMPDVSGWDLIQEMRADATLSSVPVVILSAVGKAIAPVAGVAEILPKPVDARRLLSAVVQHRRA